MAEASGRTDPFSDLISLVAGPIAAVVRSFDQLRRGADELMKGLENFNATMASLNETASRVNFLLNEFEEPVRAAMPQLTRTLRAADELTSRLAGPVDQVVPGLVRLAETLESPVFTALPTDLGAFLDAINELVRRLGPLTQFAESAGSMFGLRLPGLGGSPKPAAPAPSAPPAKKAPAKKAPAKKAATKRAPAG